MRLERVDLSGRTVVTAYGGGGFRVGQTQYDGSILLQDDRLYRWPVTTPGAVTPENLAPLLQEEPPADLIVFGTGAELVRLPPAVDTALKEKGIAAESMDTGAACRTYAVLVQEGRRVAAALIAV